jgi:hypothetical protein
MILPARFGAPHLAAQEAGREAVRFCAKTGAGVEATHEPPAHAACKVWTVLSALLVMQNTSKYSISGSAP